jgi:hypothetical protein
MVFDFQAFRVHPKGLKHETSSNNENKIEQEITTKMVIIVYGELLNMLK